MAASSSSYRGAQGLDPELIKDIEKLYGFDKPAPERFVEMIGNFLRFDLGHDGAARLMQMGAVVETAVSHMARNVGHVAGQAVRTEVLDAEFLETG